MSEEEPRDPGFYLRVALAKLEGELTKIADADSLEDVKSFKDQAFNSLELAKGYLRMAREHTEMAEKARDLARERLDAMDPRQIARVRVAENPLLAPYADLIFEGEAHEWSNEGNHLAWVATASVVEIIAWAESIRRYEQGGEAGEAGEAGELSA